MSYKTILVHLQLGRPHAAVLETACQLAERCGATLCGVAASQPMQAVIAEGFAGSSLFADELDELDRETQIAKHAFTAALGQHAEGVKWSTSSNSLSIAEFVAELARGADLILTNAAPNLLFDGQRQLGLADVLMHAGRPLLVIPAEAVPPTFQHALLAWDDSRECRRAATDALPLLQKYARVSVVKLTAKGEEAAASTQLRDVIAWFSTHSIDAIALSPRQFEDTQQLSRVASEHACDLIVAGAYGHSRLREWTIGGFTRALLGQPHFSIMLAH